MGICDIYEQADNTECFVIVVNGGDVMKKDNCKQLIAMHNYVTYVLETDDIFRTVHVYIIKLLCVVSYDRTINVLKYCIPFYVR
jgi:hypothetical protein